MTKIYSVLKNPYFLTSLLFVNILGTIYGFIWYRYQLSETPLKFLIFVPDSPTASLFFIFVLSGFLIKKNIPIMEALAGVTLFKYGVWAVGMNIAGGLVSGSLNWDNYLLIVSHGGMAMEGLLFAPFYRIKPWHLIVAAVWTLQNDIIDYVFKMMPQYPVLSGHEDLIGYCTFWLGILSVFLIYYLSLRKDRFKMAIKSSSPFDTTI